ncbi:hypothetical protein KAZ01_02290 [Candidatus Gracilibacteria bacterium]|nr:hypothetical protein [Candidatus Gracilibacteria bacterium]
MGKIIRKMLGLTESEIRELDLPKVTNETKFVGLNGVVGNVRIQAGRILMPCDLEKRRKELLKKGFSK